MSVPMFAFLSELVQRHDSTLEKPDVCYLGDSVVSRVSRHDHDQQSLFRLTLAPLRSHGLQSLSVCTPAAHMGFFFHLLRCLEKMGVWPSVVILPVNMRSFSPQWDLHPDYQCRRQIAEIEQYIRTGKVSALVADSEDMAALLRDFAATPVECPLSQLTRAGEFRVLKGSQPQTEEEVHFRYQQIFAYHYTCPLDPGHRHLATLHEIFALLERIGATAIIYLTPVNYEGGQKYVGDGFLEAFLRNVEVVSDLVAPYEEAGRARLLNYSTSLPSGCFFHDQYAIEHLNQTGRAFLADEISAAVLHMLQGEVCLATHFV